MICNTIKYRGYVGTIEISEDDNVIFGKVIRDLQPHLI